MYTFIYTCTCENMCGDGVVVASYDIAKTALVRYKGLSSRDGLTAVDNITAAWLAGIPRVPHIFFLF